MPSKTRHSDYSSVFPSTFNPSPPPQRPLSPTWKYILRRRGRLPRSVSLREQYLRFKAKHAREKTRMIDDLENEDPVVEIADGDGGWVAYNAPNPNEDEDEGTSASTESEPADDSLAVPALGSESAEDQVAVPGLERENGTSPDDDDDDDDWGHSIFSTYILEIIRRHTGNGTARYGRGNTGVAIANFFSNVGHANHAQMTGSQDDDIVDDDIDHDDFVVVRLRPLFASAAEHENEPAIPIANARRTPRTLGSNQQPPPGRDNDYHAQTRSFGMGPMLLPPLPVYGQTATDHNDATTSTERASRRRNLALPQGFGVTQEDESLNGMTYMELPPLPPSSRLSGTTARFRMRPPSGLVWLQF